MAGPLHRGRAGRKAGFVKSGNAHAQRTGWKQIGDAMPEVGKYQELKIARKTDFGFYLTDGKGEVLLPKRYAPENAAIGDRLKVFVYMDSEDRPVATTEEVPLTLGGFAALKVREVTKIGAFLDWGLPKDLFLPYAEMTEHPKAGDTILVRLYQDKSGRLSASMKGLYDLLSTRSPYQRNDDVKGRIYEFGHDFGVFVAVDDRYSAMLPRHEKTDAMRIGQLVSCRVANVKEDGKLDLAMRDRPEVQREVDEEALLSLIEEYGGVLPFTEKATPDVIQRETGLSKAAFKRAIGGLYKKRLITLEDGKIRKA